jgi:hypothetical protein
MVLPIPHRRRDDPYLPNGSDPKAQPSSFVYKPVRDIGEQGIDAEVHGMTSANNMVLPIPHRRREDAYLPNGSSPKSQPSDFIFKPLRDIGEQGLDPEVHGMTSANNMVLPIPHRRRADAYLPNGSDPSSQPSDFIYRPKGKKLKDIGEQGVNPEVHGFVSSNNMVEPTPLDRVSTAYPVNGWDPKAHSPAGLDDTAAAFIGVRMQPAKDMGEQGADPEVHGLVSRNNMVAPVPARRNEEAYPVNGWSPSAQDAPDLPGKFKYAQNFLGNKAKDIGIHDVRPDVYVVVSKIINPVPVYRLPVAPATYYEPWEEIEAKKAKDKADQAEGLTNGESEASQVKKNA